jgi:hypothetical protein
LASALALGFGIKSWLWIWLDLESSLARDACAAAALKASEARPQHSANVVNKVRKMP